MATIRSPTSEEWEAADQAYCLAVGQVGVLWATIHEDLAQLYVHRLAADAGQAQIAWYSHRSDRSQRDLLKNTIEQTEVKNTGSFPRAKDDLLWSLNRIEELSKVRNDAVHVAVQIIWGEAGPTFSPNAWSSDPRLKKLHGKDLMKRLTACRRDLQKLLYFNRSMNSAFFDRDLKPDWPSRPKLTTV